MTNEQRDLHSIYMWKGWLYLLQNSYEGSKQRFDTISHNNLIVMKDQNKDLTWFHITIWYGCLK